jgi:hypothetical protein
MKQMPHIVCFAPYTDWSIHSARQVTILQALRQRGCSVTYITCDGAFTDCDLLQSSTGAPRQRPANACLFCQARVATRLAGWGMPFRWLGQWITTQDRQSAARWIQELAPQSYPDALFHSWPIGKWMKSSVHKHFRHNVLDLQDPQTISVFGSYLYSGVLAALALDRIYAEERPSAQLLFNGRMGPTRIALELAKARNIRTICEERAYPVGRMMLFDNVNCLDFSSFGALWEQWSAIPLNALESEETKAFFTSRWTSAAADVTVFSSGLSGNSRILGDLGLDPHCRTWALFTSSLDEATDLEPLNEPFASQYDWIEATIQFVAARQDLQLVIRVHPNAGSQKSFGVNPQDLVYFDDLPSRLPQNVKLIPSTSKLSSYDLANAAVAGLVWRSTIGLEMAAMGRPVIRAAHGPMAYASFIQAPATAHSYIEGLARLLGLSAAADLDLAVHAWRFAYAFYYRWSKPFPLVHQPNWYTGELAYHDLSELGAGKHPELDEICEIFTEQRSLHCGPNGRLAGQDGHERAQVGRALAALLGP